MNCLPASLPNHAIETLESRIAPATLIVTNLDDSGAGSLREALDTANGTAAKDTIKFDGSLDGTIMLLSTLDITSKLKIDGGGRVTLSGENNVRVLNIDDGVNARSKVSLSGLTIQNGAFSGGAGIFNLENLTIKNCVISGNNSAGDFHGGGIYSANGNLTIVSSVVRDNHADDSSSSGGGIFVNSGNLKIVASTVIGNSCADEGGGIEQNAGNTTILNTVFSQNSAAEIGGGFHTDGEFTTIKNSVFSGNTANGSGGGGFYADGHRTLIISNVSCVGNEATGGNGGGAYIDNEWEKVIISGTHFTGNSASEDGGGLYIHGTDGMKATIKKCDFVDNEAINGDGGGLRVRFAEPLKIISTLIAHNQAGDEGGGVYLGSSDFAAKFIKCTIVDNSAVWAGGGIFEDTSIDPVLVKTTVTFNTAPIDPNLSGTFA